MEYALSHAETVPISILQGRIRHRLSSEVLSKAADNFNSHS